MSWMRAGADPLTYEGPLTPEAARDALEHADELMDRGDYPDAGRYYRRVIGNADPAVTAAGYLGLGEALYRLDQDEAAVQAWGAVVKLPETPATYLAWRNLAAARVRAEDLPGAIDAYRQAERRAPPEDRAEIQSRLGWLMKETGNQGAARRYFARSRGTGPAFPVTWVIIGVTVVTSLAALTAGGQDLFAILALDKGAVADGEYWRLLTVTLVHGNLLHLLFNMYALFIVGPLVEQLYGSLRMVLFYLLTAAAGSVASFVFGSDVPSVGASGAVFGLFGVVVAAGFAHNPVVDRRSRMLITNLAPLIVINLAFGFLFPGIDNAAHVGGLLAGLWLGYLFVPENVPTLARMWQGAGATDRRVTSVLRAMGLTALVVVLVIGLVVGTDMRKPSGPATTAFHDRDTAMAVTDPGAGTPSVTAR
jgi:rhomboid protease GluP